MPAPPPTTLNPLATTAAWASEAFDVTYLGVTSRARRDAQGRDIADVVFSTFGDLNGDGWPELVMSGWTYRGWDAPGPAPGSPLTLFTTGPNGVTLLDSEDWFGVSETAGTANLRIADFTGDGHADLLVTGHNESPFIPTETVLYRWTPTGFVADVSDLGLPLTTPSSATSTGTAFRMWPCRPTSPRGLIRLSMARATTATGSSRRRTMAAPARP